ncbi:hypothetical protein M409DRAFT_51729 [Zasmidium cellare ATCC 36951]|uniref:NAD dependent epimerase/dehydratase n=1 Tax=Zasmidium cellare ATCC 36951 TaxID=1080233 RepID=A0A6A6CVU9_ZASCE|nr:uncharacterized protein M409DRAFT_51729 [Zasmidium cellare ATCC 36951]KAF2169942.1 hypothetical protein M409DRAFT_51729 [Zasmidium cellare ATCC 36951]
MAEEHDSNEKPQGSNQLSVSTTTLYGSWNGIDRRKCHRVVPLRILAFGPSRSGTSSLRIALDQLGFGHVYHYTSLLTINPRDAEMWNEAWDTHHNHVPGTKFERQDWDQLLGHCGAVTDVPSCLFIRQLLEAYPDAQVILTVRDNPEQWWRSMQRTVIPLWERFYFEPPRSWSSYFYRKLFFLGWPTSSRTRIDQRMANGAEMYQSLRADHIHGTRTALDWLRRHEEEVKSLVPPSRLLVFNVKEGWEPLCRFLDVPIPAEEVQFPIANSESEWDRTVGPFYIVADVVVYGKAAALAVGLAFLASWCRKIM